MKSLKIMFTIGLITLFTATATAQQRNPDKMAERRTKAMALELKLDQQQYQKLLVVNKKMMKDRKAGKGKGKSAYDKSKADYETELKKILTTVQYNKWKARTGG